jgi:hypothetical protein
MVVNSYNCEFGYELISVLPYAYFLYSRGQLEKTISGVDSECLYYFSPNHEINHARRSWYYEETTSQQKLINDRAPNAVIHKPELDLKQFLPPPYKKAYRNDWAVLDKEIVVIYNRYNVEWGLRAINYFSIEFLESLFKKLKDYSVIYVNVEGHPELYDHATPLPMADMELCKKYNVTTVADIMGKHPGLTYNQVQMYYFSNCKKFITMNGGGGILASYFGGENIIYCLNSKELKFGDFGYYHLFGDSKIKLARKYEDVIAYTNLWTT